MYNLSGGIKAWHQQVAVGPEDLGMELLTGKESIEDAVIVAYGLEQGLRDFYLRMADMAGDNQARALFLRLADIEILHQNQLVDLYNTITGKNFTREAFIQASVSKAMEGGLSTEEYLAIYTPDLNDADEVLSLAMAIEAQALDLYQRAAQRTTGMVKEAFTRIATEEQAHIGQIAKLIDAR